MNTTDTVEKMLSMLLAGAVDTLDISPSMRRTAVARYQEVGNWLAEHGLTGWEIYPQGSFRLATVVRPVNGTGEFDIDLVCQLPIVKESTTQAKLKQRVGAMLHEYKRSKDERGDTDGPKEVIERRRCWTLVYPDDGFHLDVLPAIPHEEYPPTGIRLTDKELREWQPSNPIGYSDWFHGRTELDRRLVETKRARASVADMPDWDEPSTLQRVVQVLKWHTMLRFTREPDNRPPSILVTTLAASAYTGEDDLFTGARNVLNRMPHLIEDRDGVDWVANPAHPEENFADKWREYPERRDAFYAWHTDLVTTLDELYALSGKGLDTVVARAQESFGVEPIGWSAAHYGDRIARERVARRLRVNSSTGWVGTAAGGLLVPDQQFYGDDPDPRG